jgi:hypothetical protein
MVFLLASPNIFRGQERSAAYTPAAQEFPVIFLRNVTAGKTRSGTKVQAKLTLATMINGTVVPAGATFWGEVLESVAKAKGQASRLSVRMDSVKWKKGSMPVKLYATAWYYPSIARSGQNLKYGPDLPPSATWNGAGAYPDPNSPAYEPFPEAGAEPRDSVPDTPSSVTSKHRVLMKDVTAARSDDGGITLVCERTNLKFDRITTYVLATAEVPSVK